MSASVMAWSFYSLDHARAAAHFVRQCSKLEAEAATPPDGAIDEQLLVEHRSAVTAAIFTSVAFLEASVNELFASADHDNLEVGGGRGGLPQRGRRLLALLGEPLERASTLDRYQIALGLLDREPFETGAQPFQDTVLLVKLRNMLVHYRPEWRPGAIDGAASDPDTKVEKALVGKGFKPNPFTSDVNPFFPDRCLGHGCAAWAWASALAFASDFFRRIGVTAVYESIINELET